MDGKQERSDKFSDAQDGMTLRDYFAAHAPSERWPHFVPRVPPAPAAPSCEPVGNDGEAPTDEQRQTLNAWRHDPCWDADTTPSLVAFTCWIEAWNDHWQARAAWKEAMRVASAEQWPWFYADRMLAERAKVTP